jgi:hypothetical protein
MQSLNLLVQFANVLLQSIYELTQLANKWAQLAKGVHGKQGGVITINVGTLGCGLIGRWNLRH